MTTWCEQQQIEGVTCTKGFHQLAQVRQVSVYTYMTEGLVIDVGGSKIPQFRDVLKQQSPEAVLLTHHHEDHTGNSAWVEQHLQIPQYIHRSSVKDMAQKANNPLYRQQVWGTREAFTALPLSDTFTAKSIWDVIETPGHASDHVAFYNRSTGHLFAGDLFVAPKLKIMLEGESYSTLLHSLQNIQAIDYSGVFCHHAGFLTDARSLIDRKITYMQEFAEQVVRLHDRGIPTTQIVAELLPHTHVMEAVSDGEWSRHYLVNTIVQERDAIFMTV